MPYEDVKVKCLYCEATVEGNQKFMLGGKNLPSQRGRIPLWLTEKPEHEWVWNGLSEYILGERKSFDFYLCPLHQTQTDGAFKWAQKQIDETKELAKFIDSAP